MAEPLEHFGPSTRILTVPTPSARPADIIELIMADHRRIRRLCQALDDAARWRNDPGPDWMLGHVWERLADLLEEHTLAEEEICYLSMSWCHPQPTDRRREAMADHGDIREGISEASLQPAC